MIEQKRILGLIPARGGSKGIPGKNIKLLAGKPLLAWTIEEAKKSRFLDRIIVSSDDPEIIQVARTAGAEAPFQRPATLAQDDTPGIDPVIHALEMMPDFDYVVLLQPTSPLRLARDIDNCLESCFKNRAPVCVSVSEVRENPYWIFSLDKQDHLVSHMPEAEIPKRRQDLKKFYIPNGAVYVGEKNFLEKKKSFISSETLAFVMPEERSLDIDTPLDFELADYLFEDTPMKNILVVTPAYNEAAILAEFVDHFVKLRQGLATTADLRLLIVNDGSDDNSIDVIKKLAERYSDFVFFLSFSVNFGHQAALVAGLTHAGSWPDAVITMDADLEHPLEVVPQLIQKWQDTKSIIVNTVRNENAGLPFRKRIFSKLFYKTTALITGLPLESGQADFCLWDGHFLRSIKSYLPDVGSLRIFSAWIGGKKSTVTYDQKIRSERQSRFTFKKNLDLAISSIVRFSNFPLRMITFAGVVGFVFSIIYGIYAIVQSVNGHTVQGWTSLIMTVIFMSCLQLLSLGIIAGYLHRLVFTKGLPPYVIQEGRLPPESRN